MSDISNTPPAKPLTITVVIPDSDYDGLVNRLNKSKKGVVIQKFCGDNFFTRVWRENGRLMCRDPTRDCDKQLQPASACTLPDDFIPMSKVGFYLKKLMDMGIDRSIAIRLAHGFAENN